MLKYFVCMFFALKLSDVAAIESTQPSGDVKSAVEFMQSLGDTVSGIVKTKTGDDKRSALKEIFSKDVHHKSVAQFVLGKVRRDLRDALKEAKDDIEKVAIKKRIHDALEDFYKIYRKSIIRIYLSSFENSYKGGIFKATHGRSSGKDGATVYSTLDRQNGTPPLNLHWVLKHVCEDDQTQCTPDKSHWKVVDLRVENVSQAQKEQSETESIIAKHRGECSGNSGKFCTVVALENLTADHRKMNKAWKEKVKSATPVADIKNSSKSQKIGTSSASVPAA
jgi:ABC-type transporter MlaC component